MSYSLKGISNGIGLNRPNAAAGPKSGSRSVVKSNLATFINSTNLSNITYNSVSNTISQVDASSGSGQLTQSTEVNKPLMFQEYVNGYNTFSFDGNTQKFLSNLDYNITTGGSNKVIAILAKLDSDASGTNQIAGQWANPQNRWRLYSNGTASIRQVGTQFGNFDNRSSDYDPKNWNVYWLQFNKSLGTPNVFYMNNQSGSIGGITYSNATNAGNITFGAQNPSSSNGLKGKILEIMIFNTGNLSQAERQAEQNSINAFYGNII